MEMKDDTSTSPMSQASGSNMMKHRVVSIKDGYQYKGPGRVKVSGNGKH